MQLNEELLQTGARVMATRRPDLWTEETARETIREWAQVLDHQDESAYSIGTGGFELTRYSYEDRHVEYLLTQSIVNFDYWSTSPNEIGGFDWTRNDVSAGPEKD